MGTLNVESQSGGRRATDSEINLIPMVDLFVCCIAFLLITAVWSHSARLDTSAQVPGAGPAPDTPEKSLHVDMRGDQSFRLLWKTGSTVVSTADVPRRAVEAGEASVATTRYPDLASQVAQEWERNGTHRNTNDRSFDRAIVHTSNQTPFEDVVAVIDAVYAPKRQVVGNKEKVPVFVVAFAND